LTCLKENFNCSGSFISNEISKTQLKGIKKPEGFTLYYSIYHPIVLMTSRQCLFHQVTGCKKDEIEDSCIPGCEKSASITNFKKETFLIEKSRGNYHRIYNETNYMNTDIIADMPDYFTGFCIDLRDIKTETSIETYKLETIRLFDKLLKGDDGAKEELERVFYPTTCIQYKKGI
jgi:putative protease